MFFSVNLVVVFLATSCLIFFSLLKINFLLRKFLLFPFTFLYGIAIALRNFCYATKILKSVEFEAKIISVGNLSLGGTGKTPHIEYLVKLLEENNIHVATLSRGYRRKTNGFILADENSTANEIGDEPFQIKQKFPSASVAVCVDRVAGVSELISIDENVKAILLDDAFQHRAIKPGLNILLTEFEKLFCDDWLLPSGNLREYRSGSKRADIIIVTKCDEERVKNQEPRVKTKIKLGEKQKLFFSTFSYGNPYSILDPKAKKILTKDISVVPVSALADAKKFNEHIKNNSKEVIEFNYFDHHYFSEGEMNEWITSYDEMFGEKIILTTEKDAARIKLHPGWLKEHGNKVFVLPIEVKFLFEQQETFNRLIFDFINNKNS